MKATMSPPARVAAPAAVKLDPPSWWAGSTLNPIRLLISGRDLSGAKVECGGAGISCGPAKVSSNGHYLFVDLKIAPRAAAGSRTLTVKTPGGETRLAFEVLPAPARKRKLPRLSPDDLIYLIMPDRFAQGEPAYQDPPGGPRLVDRSRGRSYHGGNLQGIIDRLGYLKDLGATALWLTPVYANGDALFPPTYYSQVPFTHYHGYGPVDFYGVDKRLGDAATLKALIERAHKAGIKIILDQVANHSSPQHPWVSDPPTPAWFHGTTDEHLTHPFYHWMAADPYATEESQRVIMDGWLGDELPDLNQDDPEVSRYLIQNIVWWAGVYGFDAWRHDSMNYVPRQFWKRTVDALNREFPGFPNLAEVNSDDPYLVSFYQGGRPGHDAVDVGMDSPFDFPLRRAIRSVLLDGKPMSELAAALSRDRLYPDPTMLVTFVGLHDDGRFMGHPNASPALLKLAFSFLMTTRGIPMIYAADEIAMPGGDDPDNRCDFPGGWKDDARDAFTEQGRAPEQQEVFAHARRLSALRASCEALRRGRLVYLASNENLYAYARVGAAETAVVVLNRGDQSASVDIRAGALRLPPGAALRDQLGEGRARADGGWIKAEVAAKAAAVFTTKRGGKSHG